MRRTPLLVITAVVAVLALAVVAFGVVLAVARPNPATTTASASSWPAPAPVDWRACTDTELRSAGARCASVRVPLDWSAPRDGRTVSIAISRVQHTATPYAGVILANPGGPGGSGLGLATLGARVPGGVGSRYDWIGFDPRGVGDSRPRLTCQADYANGPRPAYSPATPSIISAWRTRSEGYAASCAKNGALLQHMTTRDAATDMDYLRLALGARTISFFGYSYGTYLGQVYATLFPSHLKRMVLDSTVDPTRVWYGANLDQDPAFQVALEKWFAWVADHDSTYHLGSTADAVSTRYHAVSAALAKHPAGGVFGSAEFADTFLYAGYGQQYWPPFAAALQQAAAGDTAVAQQYWRALNETTDDNGYAAYLAVQCTDTAWPTDFSRWVRDSRTVERTAPDDSWLNTWFNLPCRTWPAKAHRPVAVNGAKAPAVLMIDETLDAATPFSGSLTVRGLFPKARLIAEPGGTSHADSLSGDRCVDDAVAGYLGSGALPARKPGAGPDTTCAPLPTPTPS